MAKSKMWTRCFFGAAGLMAMWAAAFAGPGTQPARDLSAELPRIAAKSPADAERLIRCIPGFSAKLVAAEPLVFSPVAIDFDEKGRAFVCEMIDYPFVSPEPLGRIALLEDTDGDGVYDRRTVYADKIAWPTAVCCFDGGVFVGAAPDILYLKDTTGKGPANLRKTIFTGFGKQNVQGLLNSFRWGIDNRIHGATGTNGAKIHRADLDEHDPKNVAVNLNGRDFSFDPRLLDLRPESGGAQHGMCFDDFGRKFVCSNSDHIQQVVYDDRYVGQNPHVQLPPARVSIAADGPQAKVFRISPIEPWRILRTRMRVSGESPGLIEGGGQPAGYFTGATGVTIYRGDAFPPEFRGQAFIGDVGSNLVHRKVLKRTDGVLFRAERVDDGVEFLASSDIWFRPAQFANAPDGTLYVLDVCREVIEHPASLPESIKQHLDLTSGRDRGRIYRVLPDGYKQKPVPRLDKLSTEELVKLLEHRNGWHRDTASRLIYERQDQSSLKSLHAMAESLAVGEHAVRPESRIHAMYALRAIGGKVNLDSVFSILFEPSDYDAAARIQAEVFVHALRLMEQDNRPATDLAWLDRHEPDIQFASALILSRRPSVKEDLRLSRDIADRLRGQPKDPYIRSALLSAVKSNVADVFWDVMRSPWTLDQPATQSILRDLARLSAAQADPHDIARIVKAIDAILIDNSPLAAREALLGLVDGSGRSRSTAIRAALTPRAAEFLKAMLVEARQTAANQSKSLPGRLSAIRTLPAALLADVGETLSDLLGGREPQEIQLTSIAALDSFSEPEVGVILTRVWPRLTPKIRTAAIEVLLSRPNRAALFLAALDAGKIPLTDLDATRLKRLQTSKDPGVRALAEAIARRSALSPRAEVIASYKKSLELKGDTAKGKLLFALSCSACHKLEGVGTELGPNLASMQSRGPEAILVNVLDPNREVNGQFVEYVVETKEGRSTSGLLASENTSAITLLKPGGLTETVSRADIEKLRSTGLSLMPEGLEKQLDAQQLADLIAYVMNVK